MEGLKLLTKQYAEIYDTYVDCYNNFVDTVGIDICHVPMLRQLLQARAELAEIEQKLRSKGVLDLYIIDHH
ncbi:hypothetical protein [Desulforamulus hydrothermalis]|uniref:Uncharacterized protein n=1 Tax=Desulforamulus hydrothermalis Lam5 = DSM 18033 TaxID=1121428 RepID=K8DZ68_9FIRM|nr:hypothetical protein [Desulforamulus hydrothermalis]CCO08289.1 hypothetical protein DESHY_20158 [Desulforamulus hydrothermalis Lam5 = DSM 18033]SHH37814.1 hypothetical protein SAMN02745177_02356 [Desulforamulus hydrothermalis Lam5 = DSM 18033]